MRVKDIKHNLEMWMPSKEKNLRPLQNCGPRTAIFLVSYKPICLIYNIGT